MRPGTGPPGPTLRLHLHRANAPPSQQDFAHRNASMTADAVPVCEHSTEAQGAWHKSSDGGPAHAPPVPRLAPKESRERREGQQHSPDAATIGCRVTHHPDGAGSAAAPPATPAKMPERRSWPGDVQPAMTKGQYNHNAKVQALAMEPAMQLLVQAAGGVPIAPSRPLQVGEQCAHIALLAVWEPPAHVAASTNKNALCMLCRSFRCWSWAAPRASTPSSQSRPSWRCLPAGHR